MQDMNGIEVERGLLSSVPPMASSPCGSIVIFPSRLPPFSSSALCYRSSSTAPRLFHEARTLAPEAARRGGEETNQCKVRGDREIAPYITVYAHCVNNWLSLRKCPEGMLFYAGDCIAESHCRSAIAPQPSSRG